MNPVTHLLTSWTIAEAAGAGSRDRVLVTWAGTAPDLDGIGIVIDLAARHLFGAQTTYYADYHHAVLHGLAGAIVVPACLAAFAVRRGLVFGLGVAAVHVHVLCDILGSRGPGADELWPVHYLAPLSDGALLYWNGQWELNAWPNLLITLALVLYALTRAAKDGRSPAEAFGPTADRTFVGMVRRSWFASRGA